MNMCSEHTIILISGRKGVGKDTIAKYIADTIKQKFRVIRFSDQLKDCISIMFGWDRKKMDGLTQVDRDWREMEDCYWGEKLGKRITPRTMMEFYGTDLIRSMLHKNFWIYSLHKLIETCKEPTIFIIPDCRFWNEYIETKKRFKNVFIVHVLSNKRNAFPGNEHAQIMHILHDEQFRSDTTNDSKYHCIIEKLKYVMRLTNEHLSDWENILIEYDIICNLKIGNHKCTLVSNEYDNLNDLFVSFELNNNFMYTFS